VTQTSVSRAADRFFYTGPSTESFGIWSYPLAPASAPGQRFIASAKADADARYSPDGKNIAFASARAGFGQVDLWMCARDGSKQRQIATFGESGAHNAGSPSWSPNGRWIAFDAGLPGKTNGVYLLDVLGGEPKRLTKSGTQDGVPSWSSDGKWIYYSSNPAGRRDIWKLPFGGGTPVQVTHDDGFESYESPDGKFLYYTKRGSPGIWRMALPDGKPEVVAGLEAFSGRYWEGSSKGIYFVASSKAHSLEFFRFSDQRVTRIRELPEPWTHIYRGLSVSPDDRNVLYVQRDPGRMNIMVVNNFH
jgi:Tol biopolymer transport system component